MYKHFVTDKPTILDTGQQVIDATRENLMALRDAALLGALPGWDMTVSGGTTDQPAAIILSKGAERVRADLVWGTAGGGDGNVVASVATYSADGGSTWVGFGRQTIAYDAGGNVIAITWSDL